MYVYLPLLQSILLWTTPKSEAFKDQHLAYLVRIKLPYTCTHVYLILTLCSGYDVTLKRIVTVAQIAPSQIVAVSKTFKFNGDGKKTLTTDILNVSYCFLCALFMAVALVFCLLLYRR